MFCDLCGRSLMVVTEEERDDWVPYYYVGCDEQDGPACPDCIHDCLFVAADGAWELKQGAAVPIARHTDYGDRTAFLTAYQADLPSIEN